jgi:hypothetical protein
MPSFPRLGGKMGAHWPKFKKQFFFEKKNQKTFMPLNGRRARAQNPRN